MTENEKLIQAYNNPENAKILESAAKKFNSLDKDEIESCKLIALWKAMKNDIKDVKFTTSLYNHMTWQCKDRLKLLRKKHFVAPSFDSIVKKDISSEVFDMVMSVPDGEMVIDKYIFNLTLKEISRKKGLTIEQTRLKINLAKQKIASNNPD